MLYIVSGTVLVICLVFYFFRQQSPKQSGIPCDRTEDTGFYADLSPDDLARYQEVLLRILALLDAPYFEGTVIQLSKRHAVEQLIVEAAADPQLNPKYLRVMVRQFLSSDVAVRRQEEVWTQWVQKVYELDQNGNRGGTRGIPSAWKVYFNTSLHAGTDPVEEAK